MMTGNSTGARLGERHGPANEPALVCREAEVAQPYHYWRGASGKRYLHTVYPLIGCPVMPRANYILVHCGEDGTRRPLHIAQTTSDAETLNLAHLRHAAARLGANEIHVHFLAETAEQRDSVEADLAARQLGRAKKGRPLAAANDSAKAACA